MGALCQPADVEFKAQCSGRATSLSIAASCMRHGLLVGRLWGQNQSIWRVTSETAGASGGGRVISKEGQAFYSDSAEKPVNIICHRRKQTLRIAK
jgi:hypothetical protein